ncbi:MAG TPA: hypothetical protein VHX61_16685 [Rhizomicrobium sp.]|nr:hypothetical protein [Rhizomicrobium sp.]
MTVSWGKQGVWACGPECAAAKLCEGLGHIVEEATAAFDPGHLIPSFLALWSANLATDIDYVARLTGERSAPDRFEGPTCGMYEASMRFYTNGHWGWAAIGNGSCAPRGCKGTGA